VRTADSASIRLMNVRIALVGLAGGGQGRDAAGVARRERRRSPFRWPRNHVERIARLRLCGGRQPGKVFASISCPNLNKVTVSLVIHRACERLLPAAPEGTKCGSLWGAKSAGVGAVHVHLILPRPLSETRGLEAPTDKLTRPVRYSVANLRQAGFKAAIAEPGPSLAFYALTGARP
jgi:hypothetical protein